MRCGARIKPLSAAAIAGLLIIAVPVLLTVLFAESSDRAAFDYAEATRGSLHPASLLTMLIGGLFSPDYVVPYWGPYSEAWDPTRLFLSPNMSQVYAGTLADAGDPRCSASRAASPGRARSASSRSRSLVLIVYALGRYTPAYRVIFDLLPGVNAFRRPADATFLIGGATAILGGYLVHRVASGTAPLAAALAQRLSRSCSSPRGSPPRSRSRSGPGISTMRSRRSPRRGAGSAPPRSRSLLLRRAAATLVRARRAGRRAADGRRSRASTTGRANRPRCRLRATPCSIRTPRTRRSCCSSGCSTSRCLRTGATASSCSASASSGRTRR